MGAALPTIPEVRRWLGLLAIAYFPCWFLYAKDLWNRPHYQFFPLALFGAGCLGWRAWRDRTAGLEPNPGWLKVLISGAGLGLVGAAMLRSPFVGLFSSALAGVAVLGGLGGWRLVRSFVPCGLLLAILVRPPLNLDYEFVFDLRRFAVWGSSYLLEALHVPHFLAGNVIEVRGSRLFVDEACSGINSFLFVLALSLFWELWKRRPFLQTVFVVLSGATFVLAGNMLRIASGGWLQYSLHIDTLSGWRHGAIGLVLFAAYALLVFNCDVLLERVKGLFAEPRKADAAPVARPAAPPSAPQQGFMDLVAGALPERNRRRAGAFCTAVTVAGLALGVLVLLRTQLSRNATAAVPALTASATFQMPDTVGEWKRLPKNQYDESICQTELSGQPVFSRKWGYSDGKLTAIVSLDYPYRQMHDLTVCYKGHGWEMGETNLRIAQAGSDQPYAEVEMSRKPQYNGYLLFGVFASDGRWFEGLTGRLRARVGGGELGAVYQVQTLAASTAPISPEDKARLLSLFMQARKVLVQQVLDQINRHP